MNEQVEGRFKMRFIGWKADGKLMKGAPGNYAQGEIHQKAIRHSKYPWWELLEPIPEVKAPAVTEEESVFLVESVSEEETALDEEPAQIAAEDPAWMSFPPIETLNKRELIEYIESVGGEGKMSMLKKDLVERASALGYLSS